MYGLVLKDFLNLGKKVRKSNRIIILMVIVGIVVLLKSSGAIFLSIMLPIMTTGIPASLFQMDEVNSWDRYAIAMPISKNRIVASRYIVSFTIMGVGILCAGVINIMCYLVYHEFNIQLYALICGLGGLIAAIYLMFIIPANYAFGTNGNSIVMSVFLIVIMSGTYFLKKGIVKMDVAKNILALSMSKLILTIICGVSLLMALSIFISMKIYRVKRK